MLFRPVRYARFLLPFSKAFPSVILLSRQQLNALFPPFASRGCFIATFRSSVPGNKQVSGTVEAVSRKSVVFRPGVPRIAGCRAETGLTGAVAFLFVINEML